MFHTENFIFYVYVEPQYYSNSFLLYMKIIVPSKSYASPVYVVA